MTERPILFSAPMVRAILAGTKTQTRRVVKPQLPADTYTVGTYHHPDPRPHFWAWTNSPTRPECANLSEWCQPCPYGQPGDRLWVRETFYCDNAFYPDGVGVDCHWREVDGKRVAIPLDEQRAEMLESMHYRADGEPEFEAPEGPTPWRPSIHMPRWASRILLEVTGVRVERLHAIWDNDAACIAEGIEEMPPHPCGTRRWRNYLPGHPQAWSPNLCIPGNSFATLWRSINGDESWEANPWVWVVEFKRVSHPAPARSVT